jgi:hypothetical protein
MTRVADVNTTDVAAAISLGCRTMQNVFNADDDYVPFFGSTVRPRSVLSFSAHHSEAHVPGRHLNALLSAESAIGVRLDEDAVQKHRRAAMLSYSGVTPLPLNRAGIGGPLVNFCPHNLREGFHALYALTRFRQDDEARELAARSINAINGLWDPESGWNTAELERLGIQYQACQGHIHGEARMLGPLVKHYRTTRYTPALELALVVKEKLVREFFLADGAWDGERMGTAHVHSITCVLSSLAQLADLMDDGALMHRVKLFYDNGLRELHDQLGWSPESSVQRDSDHGEVNNSGDILETALLLGRWGYDECYHDAERMLRGHLLPCQLRDTSFILDPPNPDGEDGLREVAQRHLGAFGFPAPYGHESIGPGRGGISFNMDIVGGTVGSLCEAYLETVRSISTGTWVNLLFDHETDAISVGSPYSSDCLSLTPRTDAPIWVRIPPWVERDGLTLESAGVKPTWVGAYLLFAAPVVGQEIRVGFTLQEQDIVLSESLHMHPIRVRLRGDEVVAMDNFDADLTYFAPYR